MMFYSLIPIYMMSTFWNSVSYKFFLLGNHKKLPYFKIFLKRAVFLFLSFFENIDCTSCVSSAFHRTVIFDIHNKIHSADAFLSSLIMLNDAKLRFASYTLSTNRDVASPFKVSSFIPSFASHTNSSANVSDLINSAWFLIALVKVSVAV